MANPTKETSKAESMEAAYARFARIWANSEPLVNPRALRAALAALGVSPSQVTDEQLRSLNDDRVHGLSNRPFRDDDLNKKYQRITSG